MTQLCPMCGRTSDRWINRWYQYDNGNKFMAYACPECAKLHDELVSI